MAADRAPVALCGEYAGLKFSERKYRAKDPQETAGARGRNLLWKLQDGGPG